MMRLFVLASLVVLSGCDKQEPSPLPARTFVDLVDVSPDTWKDVVALECKPARVDACGAEGCKEVKPAVTIRWEPRGSYQRCDAKGCDTYNTPRVSYSGVWANVALPENGNMTRFAADGQYVEVATINDLVLVYHGQCREVRAR